MLQENRPQPRRMPSNKRSYKASKPRRPQAKKRRGANLSWLLSAFLIAAAGAGGYLVASYPVKPLQQSQFSEQEAAAFNPNKFINSSLLIPSVTRPVNILVLGMSVLSSDVQNPPKETRNLGHFTQVSSVEGLSDTILLLRFDPSTKNMTVLSIPRDTRVVMERYGVQKINAANVHGGAPLAASEISDLLGGVEIDRFVRINVLGVGKLVDALGGLTIDVPKDLKYTDESQHLYIDLKKGEQHLNGDQVMQLLRFRHDPAGDIGRIERQQLVMRALMQQALNPLKLAAMPQAWAAIQSDVDANLSVEELLGLAGLAAQVDRSKMETLMLPGESNGTGRRSTSYWLPNRRQIREMVATHFSDGDRE